MMLFRIEDISGSEPNLRKYNADDFIEPTVDKSQIDNFIASKIRDEVNGSKSRELLSYSKSLATCLLKYNGFTDNELHVCRVNSRKNCIKYISHKGNIRYKGYTIQERLNGRVLFNKPGSIQLLNFVIDVSDNATVDAYLRHYTGTGKKALASPEKDCEVVVMNPPDDSFIKEYMDAVYILYALQFKYQFLNSVDIRHRLILELNSMDEIRFDHCPGEREAFIILIEYLSANWGYEAKISKGIYDYFERDEHVSLYYDPILQFDGIIKSDFHESYNNSDYNGNVISDLFWNYCYKFVEQK